MRTMSVNLVQQVVGIVLFLWLPNVLDKEQFSVTVFVAVLLSFTAFADLGFVYVYSRLIPGLHGAGAETERQRWDSTTLMFGLLGSTVFGVIISLILFWKYRSIRYSALVAFLPVLSVLINFHVARMTSMSDFTGYQGFSFRRTLLQLIVVPFSYAFGVVGWFVAYLSGFMLLLFGARNRLVGAIGPIDWPLVRSNLKEGLALASMLILWLQLINFARFYSSITSPLEIVAKYGVATSGYQSLSAMLIALFLPFQVEINKRCGISNEDDQIFIFCHAIALRTSIAATVFMIIAVEIAPFLFTAAFPRYQFTHLFLATIFSSVVTFPILILVGSCFIGRRLLSQYFLAMAISLLTAAFVALAIDRRYLGEGGGWGQFVVMWLYPFILLAISKSAFRCLSVKIWRKFMSLYFSLLFIVFCYLFLRFRVEL